ncbi:MULTISPECIES: DNA-binding protein [unclassified Massilia]|uniref:DNA-binding protein n=1 Tax=unclassified Massilia TaxID=2609279 RepID=UPI00177FEA98|nr:MULTISPECIES: DNA-binding protein [unclassified Massilia]MBD8529460.1 DNA-binding protein [Massilia sp. CFBP 13647]MBD8672853.1 DNA-binding protein [Massilia sp. CFBP 13721]
MTTDSPSHEISFDDVAAAAGGLQDAGTPVTFDALRAALPSGSPSALARQLRAWRAEHERLPAPAPATLPAALAADLAAWAQQHAEQAGAGPRAAMARLQDDLDAALAEAGRLEEEADSAARARDAAQALADERSEEIERLMAELRNARQVAMDALVGKAKDQLAIDGKDAQLLELRGQLERSVVASSTQSDARLAAEMELVGATTARDSLAQEVKELQAQLAAAKSDRGALRMEVDALRKKAK